MKRSAFLTMFEHQLGKADKPDAGLVLFLDALEIILELDPASNWPHDKRMIRILVHLEET